MHKYSTRDVLSATHIDFTDGSMWRVDNKKSFWEWYCTTQDKSCMTLREVPGKNRPVRYDLIVSSHTDIADNGPYEVVSIIQNRIAKSFTVSEEKVELICVVTSCEKGNMVKYRLHFPYCVSDNVYINGKLRDNVVSDIADSGILGTKNAMAIYPNVVPDLDWTLYGSDDMVFEYIQSHKASNMPISSVYKGTYLGGCMQGKSLAALPILLSCEFGNYASSVLTPTVGVPQNKKDVYNNSILQRGNLQENINPKNMYSSYSDAPHTSYGGYNNKVRNQNNSQIYVRQKDVFVGEEDDVSVSRILLPMVDKYRCGDVGELLEIGRALYKCYKGRIAGCEQWINFTRDYDDVCLTNDEMRQKWRSFSCKHNMGIKSIAWFARIDSPEKYEQWNNERMECQLRYAMGACHTEVARLAWLYLWLDYACCGVRDRGWYRFTGHKWEEADNAIVLKSTISGKFRKYILGKRAELANNAHKEEYSSDKEGIEGSITKLTNLAKLLASQPYKRSLVAELGEFFYEKDFDKKLDSNDNITGIDNGVIEVCGDTATIRDGRPSDYTSLSTGISVPDYTVESPEVLQCIEWFKKCFCDDELYHYFLRAASSVLKGGNQDKVLIFFLGVKSNNSKTMIKKLFEYALGTYCVTVPASAFTKTNRGGPNPEIAQTRGARLVFVNEPEAEESMRSTYLKMLCGDDRFFARKCGKDGGPIEPKFLIVVIANQIPPLQADNAMKERLKSVPFDSVWCKEAANLSEEERWEQRLFVRDRYFSDKIPQLAPAFLWLMTQIYPEYCNEGLEEEPEAVKASTEAYWKDNDPYSVFIEEMMSEVIVHGSVSEDAPGGILDTNTRVSLTAVRSTFNMWYNSCYASGSRPPNRATFKTEMVRRIGEVNRKGEWVGWAIKATNQHRDTEQ